MKRMLPLVLVMALLLTTVACKKEEAAAVDLNPESVTAESPRGEIVSHNRALTPDEVQLVQFRTPSEGDDVVTIKTNRGEIRLVLYPEYAPVAVENFMIHADQGFYNGTSFYKVMENFYIESGAPSDKPNRSVYGNKEGTPVPFENEISTDLWHFRGALAMRNKGEDHPESNTSEFFIVQAKIIKKDWFEQMEAIGYPSKVLSAYKEHGGIPGYDTRYTVFGQVYDGMDVVDAIGEAPVDSTYLPEEPVVISEIVVGKYTAPEEDREASTPEGESEVSEEASVVGSSTVSASVSPVSSAPIVVGDPFGIQQVAPAQ